jgi:hypothetical protein
VGTSTPVLLALEIHRCYCSEASRFGFETEYGTSGGRRRPVSMSCHRHRSGGGMRSLHWRCCWRLRLRAAEGAELVLGAGPAWSDDVASKATVHAGHDAVRMTYAGVRADRDVRHVGRERPGFLARGSRLLANVFIDRHPVTVRQYREAWMRVFARSTAFPEAAATGPIDFRDTALTAGPGARLSTTPPRSSTAPGQASATIRGEWNAARGPSSSDYPWGDEVTDCERYPVIRDRLHSTGATG